MVLGFIYEMNGAKMRSQTFPNITGSRDFVKSRIPVMSIKRRHADEGSIF